MKKSLLGGALLLAVLHGPAEAYIEAIYPLKQLLTESQVVVEGIIEKADPAAGVMKIKCGKVLKGKNPYPFILVNVGVGQDWHPEAVKKHLVEGIPTLVFFNQERKGVMYLNKFFIQIFGDAGAPPEKPWWSMTHVEIRMNRTFSGTVPELSKLVGEVITGRKKAPDPDMSLPPLSRRGLLRMPRATTTGEQEPAVAVDPKTLNATYPLHAEGYVQNWLVLGPIALGEKAPALTEEGLKDSFSKEWIPAQKALHPRDEERVKMNGGELAWEAAEASASSVPLSGENALFFCLSYIVADRDISGLSLSIGSKDSSTWWLNGEELLRSYPARALAPDQNRSPAPLTLKKGVNVLLGGVVNGQGPGGACARFLDQSGKPVPGLLSSLSPTPALEDKK